MNRFLLLVGLLLLVSVPRLYADGVTDPNIGILDPPNCESGTQVFGAFALTSNSTGGGFACFQNGNVDSQTVTSVDIETTGNFFTDNCGADSNIVGFSNAFDQCSVTYYADANVTDIRFFETPSFLLSIAPAAVFEVDLNASQSCSPPLSVGGTCTDPDSQIGGWAHNSLFAGETNLLAPPSTPFLNTPEPSTVSLLAVGMLGMLGLVAVKNKNKKKSSEVLRAL